MKSDFNIKSVKIGDFIEVEGELQKNPLINYLDTFVNLFHMSHIFEETPQLGSKTNARILKQQNEKLEKQIKMFVDELKHSGTIDFILSDQNCSVVLSAQEQYLANDNVSEILGGHFKVLGKVVAICEDETENINLLRKTTLSVLSPESLKEIFSDLNSEELQQFNLPELKTNIIGLAVIVIPVAIYV